MNKPLSWWAKALLRRQARTSKRPANRLTPFEVLENKIALSVSYATVTDWGDSLEGKVKITNDESATTIKGWKVEFDYARNIDEIWDGVLVSHVGNHYVVQNESYNSNIGVGKTVSFGFTALGATGAPINFTLNGSGNSTTPEATPSVVVGDVSITEGNPVSTAISGYFHTSGNQILDENNQPVKIAGISWFGLETKDFAPHGLWDRGYKPMMDQMKELGFNTIRLPYSNQLFDAGSKPQDIDYSVNADLKGLNGLGIMDKIVEYAGKIGMRIILDHHRSDAGAGPNENGLWQTTAYPESRWISDWTMLAARYANNPTVIGADIHNEPYGNARWGDGSANDWRLAAERAGNAILAVNPNWLIVVEGIQEASSGQYWWGGNLSNAKASPVRLNIPGRLVYSPHDYPSSLSNEEWFSDPSYPNNLPQVWDRTWGYLYRENIAPILLGEFGSKLETISDRQWFDKMTAYLAGDFDGNGTNDLPAGQLGMSWTYWCWNPNSGDTGGILADDWQTVNTNKLDKLKPIQFSFGAGNAVTTALFTVTLSQASSQSITLQYATANGAAVAGSDYTAVNGTLTFAPGETTRTISVPIVRDRVAELTEAFTLQLSVVSGATLTRPSVTGTILDDDDTSVPATPGVSIGNVSVSEGNSGTTTARFTIALSAAATGPVTVTYETANGTATAGSDYTTKTGTLTFAAGETSKTIDVLVTGDTTVESDETYLVRLTSATGATITTAQATGTIRNDDQTPVPPTLSIGNVSLTEGSSGTTTARFTVALSTAATGPVTVTYQTANGTATAGSDYTAKSGTLTFAAGETSKTIDVLITGDTTVEADETFVVRLTSATGATITTAQATGTIRNDDQTPVTPTLSIGNVSVTEGNSGTTTARFTVSLSAAATGPVTVTYQTANGTATAGRDYTAKSGTLTFAAGETSKTIDVLVTGDTTAESDETFVVRLTSATGATITTAQATGTIRNDDQAPVTPTLSIGSATLVEGNSGTANVTFTVTLSQASTSSVTVKYATADGTAIAGSDYNAASGTLTFAPGETSKTITVAVRGDTVAESAETFRVVLSNPTGATIATSTGTGTITDNDALTAAQVTFTRTLTFGSAYVMNVKIKNPTSAAIDGWRVEFDLDADITSIWNGVIVSHVGTHYVIQMGSSNGKIPAGGEVNFGFLASGSGRTATNIKFFAGAS